MDTFEAPTITPCNASLLAALISAVVFVAWLGIA